MTENRPLGTRTLDTLIKSQVLYHPIIFSTESVPKILDGSKTQTRRVISPQPKNPRDISLVGDRLVFREKVTYEGGFYFGEWQHIKCPYGQVGGRLWVKETWRTESIYDHTPPCDISTDALIEYKATPDPFLGMQTIMGKWRSPYFMPRWASRRDLDITRIGGERLLDISELDARAEGFNPIEEFLIYWDIKNKKRGYGRDKNPWPWVIEFKLCDKI